MTNEEITLHALEFAKKNKLRIARELTDPSKYKPTDHPVSVFMAGSPGAGKTEFSKNLAKDLHKGEGINVVRIDGDDLRPYMPGYTGSNSHLFQGAVSLIVEKMQDLVLHTGQNFILDGTFSSYRKATENINRSLSKGRVVSVFYLYQRPEIAWKFTQAREKAEGRNIPKTAFISQFSEARETIENLILNYGGLIKITLVAKDFENKTIDLVEIADNATKIDGVTFARYNERELESLLK